MGGEEGTHLGLAKWSSTLNIDILVFACLASSHRRCLESVLFVLVCKRQQPKLFDVLCRAAI